MEITRGWCNDNCYYVERWLSYTVSICEKAIVAKGIAICDCENRGQNNRVAIPYDGEQPRCNGLCLG